MKQFYFLIYILFTFSCNQNKSKTEITSLNLLAIKITDDADIFGKWTMCTTSGNGYMTQKNVCPVIMFNQNGTGVVDNSSIGNFSWTLRDKKLHILCFDQKSNCTFPDTNYIAIFNKTENGVELTINQNEKDYSYYLAR